MKLPEELRAWPLPREDWPFVEAIVRDCARVVFDPKSDDAKTSPISHGAYLAILARYGLEPKP